jgi:predicted nucleotidyltransferase
MLDINEAFRKFRSNLELTQKEQDDASRRQQDIRSTMNDSFEIERDFLTGSYKRWTKTKPLKDVDIFTVFHDNERPPYRDGRKPSVILSAVESALAKKYGSSQVSRQRRSVTIAFPDSTDEDRIMSFDVVPAFTKGDHYEIPDMSTTNGWTETNPETHAEKATVANKAFAGEWKGMVRMAKAWNAERGKIVKPSFLLEVMALDILRPPFNGDYPREFMAFFATAADRIHEEWADPAGLGPPVSDAMDTSARDLAKNALREAAYAVRQAMNLVQQGRTGDALRCYRALFGSRFPLQ